MNTDTIIQNIFTSLKNVRWRDCEANNQYEWYYAESMHYVIHNKETNAYWFVKAKNPDSAFGYVYNRIN